MRREVAALSGLDLPPTLIFDYPSVAELAAFVVSKLPPRVAPEPAATAALAAAEGMAGGKTPRRHSKRRLPLRDASPAHAPAALPPERKLELVTAAVSPRAACLLLPGRSSSLIAHS